MFLHLPENFPRHLLHAIQLLGEHGIRDTVVGLANGAQRAGIALVCLLGRQVFLFGNLPQILLVGVGAAEENAVPRVEKRAGTQHILLQHIVDVLLNGAALSARDRRQLLHAHIVAVAHNRLIALDTAAAGLHSASGPEHHRAARRKSQHLHQSGPVSPTAEQASRLRNRRQAKQSHDSRADDFQKLCRFIGVVR